MWFNGHRSNKSCNPNGGADSRANSYCYRDACNTDCYGDTKANANIDAPTNTGCDASAPTYDAPTTRLDAAHS